MSLYDSVIIGKHIQFLNDIRYGLSATAAAAPDSVILASYHISFNMLQFVDNIAIYWKDPGS